MKFGLVFLVVLAVGIPTAFSIKCRICANGVCTGPSTCIFGDTCFTTTYKNTSKVVRGCLTSSSCNTTRSACARTPNYCVVDCCNIDGCNYSSASSIEINVAIVTVMALFASVSYLFSH